MFVLNNNDNCISITDNGKFMGRPEISSYVDTNVSPATRMMGQQEKALSGSSPSTNAFGSDQTGRSQENTGTSSTKTHSRLILKSISGLAKKDARNAMDNKTSLK